MRPILLGAGLLALVALPAGCSSCGKEEPPPPQAAPVAPGEPPPPPPPPAPQAEIAVCLDLQASPELNLYEGAAHSVVVQVHPLRHVWGFERASVEELLQGEPFEGTLGPPLTLQILPGEVLRLEKVFPGAASHVGFVADYYRAAADREGTRKVTTPAGCGSAAARIFLGPKDLVGLRPEAGSTGEE